MDNFLALVVVQKLGLVNADTVRIDVGAPVLIGALVRIIVRPSTVVASLRRGRDDLAIITSEVFNTVVYF